jgi:hypothetical protein
MRWIVVLVAVAAAACSSDATATTECVESTEVVTATVTPGTTPTFNWSAACPVWMVLVENEDGHDEWFVANASSDTTTASNTIAPPITYGIQPAGTNQNPDGPQALKADTLYYLVLWRVMPTEGAATGCRGAIRTLCLLGLKDFTP